MDRIPDLLARAAARRTALVERLAAEGTDCWRLFHGATEGLPGVAVDRYGDLVLVQLFRACPADLDVGPLAALAGPGDAFAVVDRRGGPAAVRVEQRDARVEFVCHEAGMRCLVRAAHRGQDPWLFLDLRAGRRAIRAHAEGRSVLNLFAYTCTAGVAAALAGASEVLDVDFASSALDVGRRNARLNGLGGDRVRFLRADCLAVLRQLAGIPLGRRGHRAATPPVERRRFGLVVLDPPRLATSSLGRVDLVNDYQALFKPAWLATADDGVLLATNNVASVDRDAWLASLRRCADKAGRPIGDVEVVPPDEDFPSPDGRPPLKIVLLRP